MPGSGLKKSFATVVKENPPTPIVSNWYFACSGLLISPVNYYKTMLCLIVQDPREKMMKMRERLRSKLPTNMRKGGG